MPPAAREPQTAAPQTRPRSRRACRPAPEGAEHPDRKQRQLVAHHQVPGKRQRIHDADVAIEDQVVVLGEHQREGHHADQPQEPSQEQEQAPGSRIAGQYHHDAGRHAHENRQPCNHHDQDRGGDDLPEITSAGEEQAQRGLAAACDFQQKQRLADIEPRLEQPGAEVVHRLCNDRHDPVMRSGCDHHRDYAARDTESHADHDHQKDGPQADGPTDPEDVPGPPEDVAQVEHVSPGSSLGGASPPDVTRGPATRTG